MRLRQVDFVIPSQRGDLPRLVACHRKASGLEEPTVSVTCATAEGRHVAAATTGASAERKDRLTAVFRNQSWLRPNAHLKAALTISAIPTAFLSATFGLKPMVLTAAIACRKHSARAALDPSLLLLPTTRIQSMAEQSDSEEHLHSERSCLLETPAQHSRDELSVSRIVVSPADATIKGGAKAAPR
jgi:hypothetical protein